MRVADVVWSDACPAFIAHRRPSRHCCRGADRLEGGPKARYERSADGVPASLRVATQPSDVCQLTDCVYKQWRHSGRLSDSAHWKHACLKFNEERYDRKSYLNVRSKADMSQLNLPHGTNN